LRVLKALINLTTQKQKILYKPTTSEEPGGWSLDELLRATQVSDSSRDEIKKRGATPEDFLAWILFGVADRKHHIETPVNFAISRIVKKNKLNPGGIYFEIANLPKQELIRLIRLGVSRMSGNELWDKYGQEISSTGVKNLEALIDFEA
jgi:hypothetical protein